MNGPMRDGATLSDNSKGAALMTGASLAFVLNDFMMKLVFNELSVVQGVFLRGLFVCPLLMLICLHRQQLFLSVPRGDRGIIACRTLLEIAITFLFLLALSQLSLAHVTAVLQSVPLILTAFAAIILQEQVGWRRWAAVATGFIGVILIIRPGLDGFSIFSLSVLMAAFMIAARDILTRRLSAQTLISCCAGHRHRRYGCRWDGHYRFRLAGSITIQLVPDGRRLAIPAAYVLSVATMRVGMSALSPLPLYFSNVCNNTV